MGFGNAAGSFMTGFMAGYKFIDDAEKKQLEIKALQDKAKAELTQSRLDLEGKLNENDTTLNENLKKNKNELTKILGETDNPDAIISAINSKKDSDMRDLTTYNNHLASYDAIVAGTPLAGFMPKPKVITDDKIDKIASETGKNDFVYTLNTPLGVALFNDLKNDPNSRQFKVTDDGFVFAKNKAGEFVPSSEVGEPLPEEANQSNSVKLANIKTLTMKKPEAITGFSLYPQEMITPELSKRLIEAGIKPDENGIFKDLRYSTVESVNKAIVNTSIFKPIPMYDKTGKSVLATNRDELTKYLSEGYTTTNPSVSGADTQTFNALRDDYIKKGMPYLEASKKAFTEIYDIKGTQKAMTEMKPIVGAATIGTQVAQGKDVSIEDATKASALMSPKLNPSQEKAITTFQENVVSYDEFKRNYEKLQNGIKSGAYKSDIVANIFSQWAKAVPSGNMSIFGSPEELIKKYGIEADLANSLANVLRIQSGLTVNEAEANRTVNFMMGGLNANEKVKAAAYKNFIDSTEFRLTRQATTIARYDPLTAKEWLDRDKKQNTPKFSDQTVQAAFDKHGYAPFTINGNTYIVDKMTRTIKKVKGK